MRDSRATSGLEIWDSQIIPSNAKTALAIAPYW
jgi:hypothetical protein